MCINNPFRGQGEIEWICLSLPIISILSLSIFAPMLDLILQTWHSHFGRSSPAVIVRSPGRVNIIGEHTDYNEGWVMPGAMNRSVYILVAKSINQHHWIADKLQDEYKSEKRETEEAMPLWVKYIHGTLDVYGINDQSFYILIGGDLPVGAGVSSSSSLVCGLLVALQRIAGRKESKEELALIGSRVEREVIGLQGGIMDQFAIMLSRKDHVMMLDCRRKTYTFIPASFPGTRWMLINTKVKHQLIDSDYNQRAEECKRAVAIIQYQFPDTKSLRDVTTQMLAYIHLPEVLSRRARFVLEENVRVHEMVKALEKKDADRAGKLLKASHKGLRYQYEVSCDELNHLTDFANSYDGVFGARMMGGGFGGCVLCLVREEIAEIFLPDAVESYKLKFGFEPEVIDFELGHGVEIVTK